MSDAKKTSTSIRVALVQLECHPCITLGANNFLNEPFVSSDGALLQEIANTPAAGVKIRELQTLCRDRYLFWHCARLVSVLDWFNSLSPELYPHIIVFSEGSVPRQFLKCLRSRLKFQCLMFAGTHALEDSDVAWEDYAKLDITSSDLRELKRKHQSAVASVMPVLGESYPSRINKTDVDGPIKATVAGVVKNKGCMKASVRLRPKLQYSPFEAIVIGAPPDSKTEELTCYELRTSESPEVAPIKVLPLICSEALQYIGSKELKEADLVVIPSYDASAANFKSLISHLTFNQIPTVYCNDGRFGGSEVAIKTDARPENWWWHMTPNQGSLPPGDAVLLMEVMVGVNATTVGVSNPLQNHTLLRLAPVLCSNRNALGYSEAMFLTDWHQRICDALKAKEGESVNSGSIPTDHVVHVLEDLIQRGSKNAIQELCISRLLTLARNGKTPCDEWDVFASTVWIGDAALNHATHVFSSVFPLHRAMRVNRIKGVAADAIPLVDLEQELAATCYWRCGLLLEDEVVGKQPGYMHSLLKLREKLRSKLRNQAPVFPLDAAYSLVSQMRKEATATAREQLLRHVSSLTERFGATAGMLFIVEDDDDLVEIRAGKGIKDPARTGGLEDAARNQNGNDSIQQVYPRRMVCDISFNVPYGRVERRVAPLEAGIVGHVAYTQKPYLNNDIRPLRPVDKKAQIKKQKNTQTSTTATHTDPFYLPTLSSTRSEVAVPILSPRIDVIDGKPTVTGQNELVGVLNLEARFPGAFSAAQIGEIQAAATQLAPSMRVIQSVNSRDSLFCWHPDAHGWGRNRILDRFCGAIAGASHSPHGGTSASCTVWHADAPKGVLFVKGTARFDYEYVADSMLPYSSFMGMVAQADGQKRRVFRGSVDDFPSFQRPQKAERMELSRVIATPIYREDDNSFLTPETVEGVLAVYSFKHELGLGDFALDQVFPDSVIQQLAILAGRCISDVKTIQLRVAAAMMRARLDESSVMNFDEFEQIREVATVCLDADWASLFMKDDGKVSCVSTSGLVRTKEASVPHYDLINFKYPDIKKHKPGENVERLILKGITPFLAMHNEAVIRKHNVPDETEPVICSSVRSEPFYIIAENRLREAGAATRTAHRRFVGTSVSLNQEVVGVIRLVRSDNNRPFVSFDEHLLGVLARVAEEPFQRRWLQARERSAGGQRTRAILSLSSGLAKAVKPDRPPTELDPVGQRDGAMLRLSTRHGYRPVNRRWLESFLQDYCALFENDTIPNSNAYRPLVANVRVVGNADHHDYFLRQIAYHSQCHRNLGWDNYTINRRTPCLGWLAIDGMSSLSLAESSPGVVSFDTAKAKHYRCPPPRIEEIRSGLTVPVSWVSRFGVTRGCLALDFGGKAKFNADMISAAWFASLALTSLGVEHDKFPALRTQHVSCSEWARSLFCDIREMTLCDSKGHSHWKFKPKAHDFCAPSSSVLEALKNWKLDWNAANTAQAVVSVEGSAVRFPIYIGGFKVWDCVVRFDDGEEKIEWPESIDALGLLARLERRVSDPLSEDSLRPENPLLLWCLDVMQKWAMAPITESWFWEDFLCEFRPQEDQSWGVTLWKPTFVPSTSAPTSKSKRATQITRKKRSRS